MEIKRYFIIGDIHGCLDALKRLMDKIEWDPEKNGLIFLGDYIDRGKDSRGVIDFLIRLSGMSNHVCFLMGNHESLFLDYIEGIGGSPFLFNGGKATLNSYKVNGNVEIPPEHLAFLKSLKTMTELDHYYIVHAGMRPGVQVKDQREEDLLWIRDPFIFSNYDFGKRVIFGHTPFTFPLIMDNKLGIDTGAVYGNKLTCVEVPDLVFHSVEA